MGESYDNSNLELFIYTIDEYLRFTSQLPIEASTTLIDQYDEYEYVAIQTRLMLLRKYTSKGKHNNVYFENLTSEAITKFEDSKEQFEQLNSDFNNIMQQQMEHILSDGTKLNIYETIELCLYGLYLHADAAKINQINKTHESFRFACTRKYVIDIEKIILQLYETLKNLGVTAEVFTKNEHASVIFMGDSKTEKQDIKKSPYWNNLYGHDATDEEVVDIIHHSKIEEMIIITICTCFLNELKKQPLSLKALKQLVHPITIKDWGNFSEVQAACNGIVNPGISSMVRYSEDKTLAYVRILPNVDETYIVDSPHIIADLYEISLAKDKNGQWRVYSFGGHLDSIYEK